MTAPRLSSPARPSVFFGLVICAVLVLACGHSAPTASPSPSPVAPTHPGPTATSTAGSTDAPAFDPAGLTLALEPVAAIPGSPLAVTNAADGSGRLFVAGQDGEIWIVHEGRRLEAPFLDIRGRIRAGGERGLLGLAFHPDFPADPRFFVNYTDLDGNTVVSSFRVRAERPNAASPDSEEIVLRIEQPYGNHNGGALAFGDDGHLYIATGDGGSGGDPHDNGQRLDSLLGAILRIDIDNRADGLGYAIPDDNPFAGDANARPEIWHYGLRNPWRISFDPPTGDLWIGDVGQSRFEEISVARRGAAGLNFGWARMEGFGCFPSPNGCVRPEFTLPVTDYTHDHGCAVVGGLVYRGTDFPSLVGGYLFADYCSGIIWAIDSGADEVRPPTIVAETGRAISSFGWNEAGEVYATDLAGGQLLRVVVR